jgi:methylmalonyl-CoA/ethylmalonyl-CoA epimerase
MKLHHIGIVVDDVEAAAKYYCETFNYRLASEVIEESVQQVRIVLLSLEPNLLIELIEPNNEKSPVSGFLRKGGGLHHLCYQVDDIKRSLSKLRENGSIVLVEPVETVTFNERCVAFVRTKHRGLIELIEQNRNTAD